VVAAVAAVAAVGLTTELMQTGEVAAAAALADVRQLWLAKVVEAQAVASDCLPCARLWS
jgi:hypothetical protein